MLEMYSASPPRGLHKGAAARILLATAVASFLAGVLLLASCTRKREAQPAAAATTIESGQQGAATSAQAPRAPQASQAPQAAQGARAADAKPAAPLAASLRGFGLGVPSLPRMPEDFSLGPLQSYRPAQGDEAAAFTVAKSFMDGIAAGKLDDKLLLPEARDALSVLLAPPAPSAAPSEDNKSAPPGGLGYRLGRIAMMGDDASLAVRMPRAEAQAAREEGLLSLRKIEDAWYVEALALRPPEAADLDFAADERDAKK